MYLTRIISVLLLSFSIALSGFPVQAEPMPECPMAAKMQMQQMDMEDCDGCDKMAKQEQKKSGCCDDAACNAKCSALSGGVTMNLPAYKADLPAVGDKDNRFYPADAAIASAHLNSQERPPKTFS
jgi:hypothetical protein